MDINRIRWACRRGMLELDLILLPFLENVFPGLDDDQQRRFEALLTSEDQDLFAWFLRRVEPEDADTKVMVDLIRANTGKQPTA